jgi:hypothetical protein
MPSCTPGVKFTNILQAACWHKSVLHTFYLITVWLCIFLEKEYQHKSLTLNVGEIDHTAVSTQTPEFLNNFLDQVIKFTFFDTIIAVIADLTRYISY